MNISIIKDKERTINGKSAIKLNSLKKKKNVLSVLLLFLKCLFLCIWSLSFKNIFFLNLLIGFGVPWSGAVLFPRRWWSKCNYKMHSSIKHSHKQRCHWNTDWEVSARHAYAHSEQVCLVWGACQRRWVMVCVFLCVCTCMHLSSQSLTLPPPLNFI